MDCDRHTAEGLALIDDGLPFVRDNPDSLFSAVINALALCYSAGDVERARHYELLGHQLLQHHAGADAVRAERFLLHWNLGLFGQLRHEPASAYWHFTQGLNCLPAAAADSPGFRTWVLRFHLRTAEACLGMSRWPEAEDALRKAQQFAQTGADQVEWTANWADYQLQAGRCQEAAASLRQIADSQLAEAPADTRARFYLSSARVAQAVGDLREFHASLAKARDIAAANALDYLLSQIQRVQRSPVTRAGIQ